MSICQCAPLRRNRIAHERRLAARGQVRISVSNLDLDFLNGLGPLKTPLMEFFKDVVGATVAPKFDMDLDMIYGADGKPTRWID